MACRNVNLWRLWNCYFFLQWEFFVLLSWQISWVGLNCKLFFFGGSSSPVQIFCLQLSCSESIVLMHGSEARDVCSQRTPPPLALLLGFLYYLQWSGLSGFSFLVPLARETIVFPPESPEYRLYLAWSYNQRKGKFTSYSFLPSLLQLCTPE